MTTFSKERVEIGEGISYWSKGLESKLKPIVDDARVSFWKATGVLPEHQIDLERAYSAMATPVWSECELDTVFPDGEFTLSGGGH
jgi:hypothetical protein